MGHTTLKQARQSALQTITDAEYRRERAATKEAKAQPILGNASIRAELVMLECTLKEMEGQMRYNAEKLERIQRKLAELRERLK